MQTVPASEFPSYTRRERAADRVVHLVGVPGAAVAAICLLASLAKDGTARQLTAAALYSFGLVGMVAASAAYNLVPPSRAKRILRRLDHAMIFVMIAGSYTPFALCALGPDLGIPLFLGAWSIALIGSTLKLIFGNRYGTAFLLLYLAHGWMLVAVIRPVLEALSVSEITLLLSGGAVYSLGTFVHTRDRWPFHNAIWHWMVVVAAALQLGAITQVLASATH